MSSSPSFFRCLGRLAAVVCAIAWMSAQAAASPGAGAKSAAPLKLRVVGGLGNLSQFTQLEASFGTQELARLSQGRFSAEGMAFDRATIALASAP